MKLTIIDENGEREVDEYETGMNDQLIINKVISLAGRKVNNDNVFEFIDKIYITDGEVVEFIWV